jgi:hypothetical protein
LRVFAFKFPTYRQKFQMAKKRNRVMCSRHIFI